MADFNVTYVNCSSVFSNQTNETCLVNITDNSSDNQSSAAYVPTLKEGARTYFIVGLVLSWIWTVLIILLNLVVIAIICGYKKKSRLYFFLLNLAIADLATGIVDALPHALERTLGLEYVVTVWVAGNVFCKLQRTAANVCMMTSNYILAAMSMDRAYAICKPMLNIQRGNLLQKAIVISCWLLCFVASSPLLKYTKVSNYPNWLPFSHKQQCSLYFEDVLHGHTVRLYLMFVLMFLVPLFVIIASYTILVVFIYRRALKQTASEKARDVQRKSLENVNDEPNTHGTARVVRRHNRGNMSRVFNKALPKSKMKSVKLTLGIVSSFLLCWMAYFTGFFLAIYSTFQHPSLMILTTFYYWNSIANPILFFIYHRRKMTSRASVSWVTKETSLMKHTRSKDGPSMTSSTTRNTIELLLNDESHT